MKFLYTGRTQAIARSMCTLRTDHKLTQRGFASLLGCSYSTVASIEIAQRQLMLVEVFHIAERLNEDSRILFGRIATSIEIESQAGFTTGVQTQRRQRRVF